MCAPVYILLYKLYSVCSMPAKTKRRRAGNATRLRSWRDWRPKQGLRRCCHLHPTQVSFYPKVSRSNLNTSQKSEAVGYVSTPSRTERFCTCELKFTFMLWLLWRWCCHWKSHSGLTWEYCCKKSLCSCSMRSLAHRTPCSVRVTGFISTLISLYLSWLSAVIIKCSMMSKAESFCPKLDFFSDWL